MLRYEVGDFFDSMRASCAAKPERGGILIGSYRGPHIEITEYTEPGSKDIAGPSSFKRIDEHHQRAATNAWKRSGNTATFVGEWHSHPSGPPHPSGLDRQTWKAVVTRLNTPCLFVIVSPTAWQLFRVLGTKPYADVVPMTEIEHGTTGIVYR
ncbi:hypothetical protein HH303_18615 [Rhodospirillaceae bacterium KN72]|uniref:JAB domain-containing protein n=1 Tax=Pacificispira spongiicola TaxID=2729598 RepID=A0A7Y0E3G2_9PROT|nr:hypothetical protein [Pacificispira spongiicola]